MAKRWNQRLGHDVRAPKVDAFLHDVVTLCRQHGLSIAHEDNHGAFIIQPLKEANLAWLGQAHDDTFVTQSGPREAA